MTPKTTIELLEACKAGKPPAMGRWGSLPMNGQVRFFLHLVLLHIIFYLLYFNLQVSCEGPLGKTSLKDPLPSDPAAYFRSDDMSPKVDPATVKKTMGY